MHSLTIARCRTCGQAAHPADRFCAFCGASLESDAAEFAPLDSGPRVDRILEALRAATLGEYDVAGELGRGGMAVVFLAHDIQLNRKVAIKALLPELLYTEGMDLRFKQEARVAAKLDHPNILVIYGVRESKELLYIVMKLVDGRPLSGVLRHTDLLPIAVAQYVVHQVADALNYAHGEGVVHRDVKPANIMVDRRGNLIVMDFGIAKAVDEANLTRTGLVIGTPAYMSPEQCLAQRVTPAADQYSLGTVAYELLTGRTPFRGSPLEMQWAHTKETPEPIRAVRPDCPPELETIVLGMLAKKPADRWPSLQDVVDALALEPAAQSAARQYLATIVAREPGAPVRALPTTPISPILQPPPRREDARGHQHGVDAAPPPMVVAPQPRTVGLTPNQVALESGESIDLALVVDGAPPGPDIRPSWTSSDLNVARVSDAGAVTAVSEGTADIVATLDGAHARCVARVSSPRVAVLKIDPPQATLRVGARVRITLTAESRSGREVPARGAWFTSVDPDVARVGRDGTVEARSVGITEVSATLGEAESRTRIVVVPVPVSSLRVEPLTLTLAPRKKARVSVSALDETGKKLVGRTMIWASRDPAIAIVDSGRIQAVAPGNTAVEVACEGRSVSVSVTVPTTPLVAPDPDSDALRRRNVRRIAGAVGSASVVVIAAVIALSRPWRDSAETAAAVAPPAAVAKDSAAVTSRDSAASTPRDSAPTPTPPPSESPPPVALATSRGVVALGVSPGRELPDLEPGDSSRIVAQALDRDQRSVPSARMTWRSASERTASVSATGWVKAVSPGETQIVVRADSISRSVSVRVVSPRVARVVVAHPGGRAKIGETRQLTATALDKRQSPMGAERLTWRSLRPEVAAVDDRGVITARAPGQAPVVASAGGVADTVLVDVDAPAPAVLPPPRTSDTATSTRASSAARRDTAAANTAPTLAQATAETIFGEFPAAINSRSIPRLTTLSGDGGGAADARMQRDFVKFVRDAQPLASLQHVQIGAASATGVAMTSAVRFSWRNNGGIPYDRIGRFTGLAVYSNGAWTLRDVRLVTKFW